MKLALILNLVVGFLVSSTDWFVNYSDHKTDFKDIHIVNDNIGFAVGDQRGIYDLIIKTENQGKTWREVYKDSTQFGPGLYSVFFVNENKGWVCGRYGKILYTEDGGLNWTFQESNSPMHYLEDIFFSDERKGWVVGRPLGSDSTSLILKTTDAGESWQRISQFPHFESDLRGFNSVVFKDSLIGWAVGPLNTIIQTTDGGITWEQKNESDFRGHSLLSIFFSQEKLWAVGSRAQILSSDDFGETWYQQYVNLTQNLYSVYFFDKFNGFAVGNQGSLIYTEDGGTNWYQKKFSTSAGIPNTRFNSVCFSEDSIGWIAADNGYILTTNKAVTGIQNRTNKISQKSIDLNNYPNPFNSTTKIKYNIPKNSEVIIKVFGIQENEITELVNGFHTAGKYEINFNASNFSSGVYFYRLHCKDIVVTKKCCI